MNPIYNIPDLDTYKKEVVQSNGLTLVKFGAAWSGTSEMIAPIFYDLAREYHHEAKFFCVSIDETKELEVEFNHLEIPTILFFRDGEITDQIKGAVSRQNIASKIEFLLHNN
ncbi:MAG: thioredoxin domain-containing protein [Chitinophagales bacterium]